jgi:hypothetical protein
MSRGLRILALTAAGVLVVGTGAILLLSTGVGPLPDPQRCIATASGRAVAIDLEQAENAAIVAGVAMERDLPARAVTIALATAYQESDIRNIAHGDRDSLGLFQQRPSQGWGTPRQVRDPRYAAGRFYDALVRIDGYRDAEITVVAQEVQRSGFPDAYAEHEDDARILASALTGNSTAALHCVVRHSDVAAEEVGDSGLTPRARTVRADIRRSFGAVPVGGFDPSGVSSGHIGGSAHYDGRAIDVFFRPVDEENRRRGWALAHFLVARAKHLKIQTVIYDDRIWSAGMRSEAGWRDYREPDGANEQVLQHRDHVHVDVVDD